MSSKEYTQPMLDAAHILTQRGGNIVFHFGYSPHLLKDVRENTIFALESRGAVKLETERYNSWTSNKNKRIKSITLTNKGWTLNKDRLMKRSYELATKHNRLNKAAAVMIVASANSDVELADPETMLRQQFAIASEWKMNVQTHSEQPTRFKIELWNRNLKLRFDPTVGYRLALDPKFGSGWLTDSFGEYPTLDDARYLADLLDYGIRLAEDFNREADPSGWIEL